MPVTRAPAPKSVLPMQRVAPIDDGSTLFNVTWWLYFQAQDALVASLAANGGDNFATINGAQVTY